METDSGFGDLLEQAKQLSSTIGIGELPRVQRNLKQLLEASQRLAAKTTQAGVGKESNDVKATLLLGYTVPKMPPRLEALATSTSLGPLEPLPGTDVERFLRNERENTVLSVIEEARNDAFARTKKQFWENMLIDWEQQKQSILNSFAGNAHDVAEMKMTLETSVSEPTNIAVRSVMDNIEIAYARQVSIYNESVIHHSVKPNLAAALTEVAATFDDKNVSNLWGMVQAMVDGPVKIGDDTLAARVSPAVQSGFACQARKYLEETYVKYIKATVYENLQQAALGGVPGTIQLVRSFLKVRLPVDIPMYVDGKVDGHPVWPMIYYCMRCGDLAAALKIAGAAGAALNEFWQFLTEYAQDNQRQLSPRSESAIRIVYRRSVHISSDPFKKIVYCIVGCCDVRDDHSEVADKIDDYLWLKLCQIRTSESDGGSTADHLTFSQFQTKLLNDYGELHFHGYQQPFLYFEVLFLTAQFEAAIEFLSRIDRLRCHAVHIALALYEANLLALPQSIHSPLLSTDTADLPPMKRLNFFRLVTLYTRKFESTDPREALQYFYFLRNLRGVKNENLFMTCVSELVLESREFDMLLGRLEPNGSRRPGLIDKFGGDTQKVIESVAVDSETRGMFEDAVQLYDLAQQRDKVLEVLVKVLGQMVSQPSVPQSRKDRFRMIANSVAERYRQYGLGTDRTITATFFLLLDLMTFFDTYYSNKHHDALDIVKKLKLVPFEVEEVEQYIVAFQDLADEIRRYFPDILLACMNCLQVLVVSASNAASPGGSQTPDDGRKAEKHVAYLQRQAKTLITFGGMLPYRMPGDTMARLVQKEMLLY